MENNKIGLGKKIVFSILLVFTFFIALELAARTYHYIKYKDSSIFLYGRKFINNMIAEIGSVKIDDTYDFLIARKYADRAFEERFKAMPAPDIKKPQTIAMFGYPAYINKFGFRGEDIELKKDPGTVRIIALGGSFVECVGVADDRTWEYLLDRKMKALPGKYEIINAGSGALNIDHLLASLIKKIAKFGPDHLILISAFNNHSLLRCEQKLSFTWKMSRFFYNISQLYAMIREKAALKLLKDNNYFLYNYGVKAGNAEVDELMDLYRKRLGQIYTVCKENKINLILGLQPEFIPNGLKDLQNLLDEKRIAEAGRKLEKQGFLSYHELEYYLQGRFNLEMKRFAEENGILLFDGVSIFPEDKYPYFIDQIHLNDKGTRLFADALFVFLKKNLGFR